VHHHRGDLPLGDLLELRDQLVAVGVLVVPSRADLHGERAGEMLRQRVNGFVKFLRAVEQSRPSAFAANRIDGTTAIEIHEIRLRLVFQDLARKGS
jgi:hypothetical protein